MYIPKKFPMENSMGFTSLVTVVSPIPRVTIVGISQQKSQLIFSDDDITVYFWLVNSPMLVKVKALQMPNCWLDLPAKLP